MESSANGMTNTSTLVAITIAILVIGIQITTRNVSLTIPFICRVLVNDGLVFFVELVVHAVRAAAPWIPPWAHALELQLLVLGVLQQGSPWVCWSRVIIIIMLVMVTQHIPTMTKSHNGGKMSATMKMGMCQCQKPTIHHTL